MMLYYANILNAILYYTIQYYNVPLYHTIPYYNTSFSIYYSLSKELEQLCILVATETMMAAVDLMLLLLLT